jgi:hypothetical protein
MSARKRKGPLSKRRLLLRAAPSCAMSNNTNGRIEHLRELLDPAVVLPWPSGSRETGENWRTFAGFHLATVFTAVGGRTPIVVKLKLERRVKHEEL